MSSVQINFDVACCYVGSCSHVCTCGLCVCVRVYLCACVYVHVCVSVCVYVLCNCTNLCVHMCMKVAF